MPNFFNKITKSSIYILVFLLPLFFLPFSFEAFEYSKQYLLFFLVSLAFFAWILRMTFYDKEIRFRWSPFDLFVLGFLAVALLSTIFSVDKSSSLYGFYGRFSNGLIGLLSLGALYFLIINNIQYKENASPEEKRSPKIGISKLLNLVLWSSGLVVLMSYFSIFGVWLKISNFLPGVMSQITFNPVAGSLEGLSVFLGILVIFLVGLMMSKIQNIFYWVLLVASLGLLVIVDFTAAWLIVLTTLALFVGFGMWRRIFQENVNRLLIPIFLIIIAAILIPLQPLNLNLPREQVLSQQTSWEVAIIAATDNVKSGFLGSGIGTFHYDFAKHKPLEINQTWLWQVRFDRAGSYLAELLATTGFLGIGLYFALIGFFFLISWFLLLAGNSKFAVPLLMVFVALLIGQFVYYQNTTLAFLFWLTLGLSAANWQKLIKEKVISFKDFPELSLAFSTSIIILGVAILALYFFAAKFYLADINYAKAQMMFFGAKRTELLENAVRLNPHLSQYRIILARAYFNEALVEMVRPQAEQDSAKIQGGVARAVDQAKIAIDLTPNWVAAWETLGMIYREIRGIAAGATEWGIRSFEEAIKLEPMNPVLYTELGKLYLATNNLEEAKENFSKAIEKKSDYIDALIQQAILLEGENNMSEALAKMENLASTYPFNSEVLFQLGRLYFNNNQIDKAIEQFKGAIVLFPNHSNAHYSLGVAYGAKGERKLAIQEFEKVLELNPGNQDVIQKLKQLRGE